jgi:anti-anti-sigma factor
MKLDTQSERGVTILRLAGRLDATTAPTFQEELLGILASSSGPVLLDFEQLEYISSAGLRVLILGVKKQRERDGVFALCGLQENVSDVLRVTGFLPLFRVFTNQEAAVAELAR